MDAFYGRILFSVLLMCQLQVSSNTACKEPQIITITRGQKISVVYWLGQNPEESAENFESSSKENDYNDSSTSPSELSRSGDAGSNGTAEHTTIISSTTVASTPDLEESSLSGHIAHELPANEASNSTEASLRDSHSTEETLPDSLNETSEVVDGTTEAILLKGNSAIQETDVADNNLPVNGTNPRENKSSSKHSVFKPHVPENVSSAEKKDLVGKINTNSNANDERDKEARKSNNLENTVGILEFNSSTTSSSTVDVNLEDKLLLLTTPMNTTLETITIIPMTQDMYSTQADGVNQSISENESQIGNINKSINFDDTSQETKENSENLTEQTINVTNEMTVTLRNGSEVLRRFLENNSLVEDVSNNESTIDNITHAEIKETTDELSLIPIIFNETFLSKGEEIEVLSNANHTLAPSSTTNIREVLEKESARSFAVFDNSFPSRQYSYSAATSQLQLQSPVHYVSVIRPPDGILPVQNLNRMFGANSKSQQALRNKRAINSTFCKWIFRSDPGVPILLTFKTFSTPDSIDCKDHYISVEREGNGFQSRWCGVSRDRPGHASFARSEISLYLTSNGDGSFPTGFSVEIQALDLKLLRKYAEVRRIIKAT